MLSGGFSSVSAAPRILVVDDDEAERRLLVEALRRQRYRLYVADNGRDGYEKARYVAPDLIVMDVHMPGCDGIAACRLLKADAATADIPLIFLSAAAQPEERVLGLSQGAVDYIAKPFNFDEVSLRVGIHLNVPQQTAPSVAGATATAIATTERAKLSVETIVFRAAQRILLNDLAHPPQLAELARAVGTNTKRLNEAFKECAGTTVFEYLHEERMQEARRQLVSTGIDVTTIAAELGYGSAGNFSTAFRLRFGLSPRQYRKAPADERDTGVQA